MHPQYPTAVYYICYINELGRHKLGSQTQAVCFMQMFLTCTNTACWKPRKQYCKMFLCLRDVKSCCINQMWIQIRAKETNTETTQPKYCDNVHLQLAWSEYTALCAQRCKYEPAAFKNWHIVICAAVTTKLSSAPFVWPYVMPGITCQESVGYPLGWLHQTNSPMCIGLGPHR